MIERMATNDPAPLVCIIMGSKSDWGTKCHADQMLTRFRGAARVAGDLGAPHPGRD